MTASLFLFVSESVALSVLGLAAALTILRLVRGPTLPDRVLALDMLTTLAVSIIGVLALRSGIAVRIDIALALCLVGFVSTVALARYVLSRPRPKDDQASPAKQVQP